MRPRKNKTGAFLRWYGPRDARHSALLVETREPDPDTPEAMYQEPTKSSFAQIDLVRNA